MKQWYILETKADYNRAVARYEKIKDAKKGSSDYKEMLLLALLINQYEKNNGVFPKLIPLK